MDDHAVLRAPALREQAAQGIAFRVGEMLPAQQRIAEGQPGRNAVFPRQGQHLPRVMVARAHAAAAPEAVLRRTVQRADGAPVVEVLPVGAEQRQKHPVQLVKLKQAGKMIVSGAGTCVVHGGNSSFRYQYSTPPDRGASKKETPGASVSFSVQLPPVSAGNCRPVWSMV